MNDSASASPDADRENLLERARRLISARTSLRLDELSDMLDPNISMTLIGDPGVIYPLPNKRFGREAVIELVTTLQSIFTHRDIEIIEMAAEGDTVAVMRQARLVHRGTGRSGVVILNDWIRFRGGRVVEVVQINDNAALRRILADG